MIVDRYDPVNLFELVPKLKLEMEPELANSMCSSMTMNSSLWSEPIFSSAIPTREGSGAIPRLLR